jgi:hypothetical protein
LFSVYKKSTGYSEMTRPILVLCEACQSEGRIYRGQYDDERDCGECPVCEGTGSALIQSEAVEPEDEYFDV